MEISERSTTIWTMSGICIVNLKKHNMKFDEMNLLSKKLVKIALKNNIGIFFNNFDYDSEFIKQANFKTFFLLSDSFLYRNCDFWIFNDFELISDEKKFKKWFYKSYKFFTKIFCELSKFNISTIEVYISNDGEDNVNNFKEIHTTKQKFLDDFYKDYIEESDIYCYGIPTIKFVINLK